MERKEKRDSGGHYLLEGREEELRGKSVLIDKAGGSRLPIAMNV